MRERIRKMRVFVPALAPVLGVVLTVVAGAQGDQAQSVLASVREALGGDGKIKALKSLTAEGSYRRTFGEREMSGDLEWYMLFPDKFQRVEQFPAPGGMPGPRVLLTLNGAEGWSDQQGGPPGMMIFRPGMGGPGGPGGPGGGPGGPGGPGGAPVDPAEAARRAASFIRTEYHRIILGVLPVAPGIVDGSGLTFTHAGQAESNDATADILDIKGERFTARLFVDTKTHLPLMLTYMAPAPRVFGARREGETPEQIRQRMEEERARMQKEGPTMVENSVFFSEHKKVDGILLPHHLARSVDGKTTEEIDIKKYKVNAALDPQQFVKKGS